MNVYPCDVISIKDMGGRANHRRAAGEPISDLGRQNRRTVCRAFPRETGLGEGQGKARRRNTGGRTGPGVPGLVSVKDEL